MKNDWKEEFSRKFVPENSDGSHFDESLKTYALEIKSFIESLLASQKEEIVKALMGMVQKLPDRPCLNLESRLTGRCFDCEKTRGYNTALTDIIAIIKGEDNKH